MKLRCNWFRPDSLGIPLLCRGFDRDGYPIQIPMDSLRLRNEVRKVADIRLAEVASTIFLRPHYLIEDMVKEQMLTCSS